MLRVSAFLLGLIVTATPALLPGQQTPNRRPGPFQIYGPVHTIRDERATFTKENGTWVEGPKALIQIMEYSEDGTKQDRTLYVPEGNLILCRLETYTPDGRILETSSFQNGILTNRAVSTYNDQKQLIERVTYRPDGSVSNRTVFRRQDNQRESESWSYDMQGGIIRQSKTTNDLPAKRAESISVDPRGVVQTQSTMADNPDGSREFRIEQSNGGFKREVVIPIGKGGEERVTYNKDGTIKSKERVIREFDSYHNMIKTTQLAARGDSQDFEPVEVGYRTITYYGKD